MTVISVGSESDGNRLTSSAGGTVLMFTLAWSAADKKFATTYEELSNTHHSIQFAKVDVDTMSEWSAKENVNVTPTFLGFREGQLVGRVTGSDREKLEALLAKLK
ncbi:thioredoxin family protein [Streptomyces sp. 5.8]|uniref:thioredoxin family protein n=1 Tax=Streptomyces sp. 5.8 TaxID=3406571 RepID=UPI003BB54A4E